MGKAGEMGEVTLLVPVSPPSAPKRNCLQPGWSRLTIVGLSSSASTVGLYLFRPPPIRYSHLVSAPSSKLELAEQF